MFRYANEADELAFEAHVAMRIQQIKDGTIPFRNFITLEQLEEMARERGGTLRDR